MAEDVVRVDGNVVRVGGFGWQAKDAHMASEIADAIQNAITDAVATERARCQKWLDVGQNEMDRAYNGIVEGRNWRDG